MAEREQRAKLDGGRDEKDPRAAESGGLSALVERFGAPAVHRRMLQRRMSLNGPREQSGVHEAATRGVSGGGGGSLPHLEQVQRAFGKHDVSGVRAHTDAPAAQASRAIGAQAYALDGQVAFDGAPSLHTAAHEAAHVVQQRGGVQLKGGVGEEGDAHERHADAVADLVVRGESAEPLLDAHARGGGGGRGVQRLISVKIAEKQQEFDKGSIKEHEAEIRKQASEAGHNPEKIWKTVLAWAEDEWDHPDSGSYGSLKELVVAAAAEEGSGEKEEGEGKENHGAMSTVIKQIAAQYDPATYFVAPAASNEELAAVAQRAFDKFESLWKVLQAFKVEGSYNDTIDALKDAGLELVDRFSRVVGQQLRGCSNDVALPGLGDHSPQEKASNFDKVMYKLYANQYVEKIKGKWNEDLKKAPSQPYVCHQDAARDILAIVSEFRAKARF